jgi:hypothetical protein
MALHPKYKAVEHKCSECYRDDAFIDQAKDQALMAGVQTFLMINYAKGWSEEKIWQVVLASKLNQELVFGIKAELLKSNPKAIENVERRNQLAESFAKMKVSDKLTTSAKSLELVTDKEVRVTGSIGKLTKESGITEKVKKVDAKRLAEETWREEHLAKLGAEQNSWEAQAQALSNNEDVVSWLNEQADKEATSAIPHIKGSAATEIGRSFLQKAIKAWNTPLHGEEEATTDSNTDEWDVVSESEEDEWVQLPGSRFPK